MSNGLGIEILFIKRKIGNGTQVLGFSLTAHREADLEEIPLLFAAEVLSLFLSYSEPNHIHNKSQVV